jgi:PhzF family phenazine biosynthesis protein
MRWFRLRSFGREGQTGNEVCVVQGDALATDARLLFAQARGVPATVFQQAPRDPEDAFDLDFFYPHTRSKLCVTATLAAGFVHFAGHPGTRTLQVGLATLPDHLTLLKRDTGIFLRVQAHTPPAIRLDREAILPMLGLGASSLVGELAVSSVGSPKLLVEVRDRATLWALKPDLAAVFRWGSEHGISGCYAYCQLQPGTFAGRNFNHLDPALEDAATGTAAGALALHLKQDLVIEQGDHLGRPCSVHAAYQGETVEIGGRVVLLREETLADMEVQSPGRVP